MIATCLAGQLWPWVGLIVFGLFLSAVLARVNGEHVGRDRGIASRGHPCAEPEPFPDLLDAPDWVSDDYRPPEPDRDVWAEVERQGQGADRG